MVALKSVAFFETWLLILEMLGQGFGSKSIFFNAITAAQASVDIVLILYLCREALSDLFDQLTFHRGPSLHLSHPRLYRQVGCSL